MATKAKTHMIETQSGVSIENKLTRVGMIGIFTQSIAPAGVLYYNGASPLRTDFPYLWQWAQDQDLVDNLNAAKFGTGDGITTFRLPDWRGLGIRGSGISSAFQMANGAYYDGGALMTVQLDQIQGHYHGLIGSGIVGMMIRVSSGAEYTVNAGGTVSVKGQTAIGEPVTDGTNGPPNIGSETRGVTVGIHFGVFYE